MSSAGTRDRAVELEFLMLAYANSHMKSKFLELYYNVMSGSVKS